MTACSRCFLTIHRGWPATHSHHGAVLCWRCTEELGLHDALGYVPARPPLLSPKAEKESGVTFRVALVLLLALLLAVLALVRS